MNYYVKSVVSYISDQLADFTATATGNKRLQFMIPQLPANATLALAQRLEDLCFDNNRTGIELEFKVAPALVQTWGKQDAEQLNAKYLATGSLTRLRNTVDNPTPVLQILVGSAKVTDKGSLADFHQCDKNVLWHAQLKNTFSSWIKDCFEIAGIIYDNKNIEHVDSVLKELCERFDILQISNLLEEIPFAGQDGRSAERDLLAALDRFNLPDLQSFKFDNSKRTFRYYIDSANSFFNYEAFMDPGKRKKALDNLYEFINQPNRSMDHENFSPFDSEDSFLSALQNFIVNNEVIYAEKLFKCDFIYIWDVILKFRPPTEPSDKKPLRKLSGSPIEVILHSLWLALGKFNKETLIKKIILCGKLFKHDYLVAENDITVAGQNDVARKALQRLMGGIDELCTKYIQINPYNQDEYLDVVSNLLNDDIAYSPSKTAEPYFEFWIDIIGEKDEREETHYAWKLPEIQNYRLADGLIAKAVEAFEHVNHSWVLPAFHLTYYQELMAAKDEEEICRVLAHCVNECRPDSGQFMSNLFSPEWQAGNDPFGKYLEKISITYRTFIFDVNENGLHAALMVNNPEIFAVYKEAAEAFAKSDERVAKSYKLASMLMRAFLVVADKGKKDITKWAVAKYEPSGIVTILHPALLEMLQAQIAFLFSAFNATVREELADKPKFKESKWQYYIDMASIQMPLTGLLVDEDLKLDVNVTGRDLLHRLGNISLDDAPLTTRLMVRYDNIDDEDVSDSEIFKVSRESKLLLRILKDYRIIHPQAKDGISIAVYRNDDIQPILAAIHNFLKYLADEQIINDDVTHKYFVKIVLFSESADETGITNWLEQWQERWEAAETESCLSYYKFCEFAVAHRIVSPVNDYKQFKKTLDEEIDCDIFILYNFIEAGRKGNKFKLADEFDSTQDTLKFPILEKSLCASSEPDEKSRRAQIISNRQFRINALHTEIMARLKQENTIQGQEHVILGYGDFEPWKKVIDAAHNASEWVVCIDANIDEGLIAYGNAGEPRRRELIGFGSGVGLHGESNYTISTQKFFISDLKRILLESIKKIYKYGSSEDDIIITDSLMQSAKSLAGLSLIRALGPSEYIRDFMSYSLMRKILPLSGIYLCDQVFSIDAYRHWFDMSSDDDKTHPDLLWIRAYLTDNKTIRIEAKLFECKMAEYKSEHIEKAKAQIENGLKVLGTAFCPKNGLVSDIRPDQRYWHLQLHRLIASRANIKPSQESDFLNAMEKLSEGNFEISWGAAIFTFWTDSQSSILESYEDFEVIWGDKSVSVPIYSAGYKFLKNICSGNVSPIEDWSNEIKIIPQKPDNLPLTERITEAVPEPESANDTEVIDEESDSPQEKAPAGLSNTENLNTGSGTVLHTGNVTSPQSCEIPARILLGRAIRGNKDIFWEFGHPNLNNRHMLIFGNSGMGKTYAIQAILCELGIQCQNSLIVDYTNGFLNNQLQQKTKTVLQPVQHIVKTDKLPINPFKKQSQEIDEGMFITDSFLDVAKRISATFKTVYDFGPHQFSLLTDAIDEGLQKFQENLSLNNVMDILHQFLDDEIHANAQVMTVISKLKTFVSEEPFADTASGVGWKEIFTDSIKRCHVFQLTMIDRFSSKILTEFILWDLYSFVRSSGSEQFPKVVILDEVQNLDHSLDAPVAKYLTEGRKFGISLIAATQTLSNLDKDQQARLFQAAHKLFFRPADPEMAQYADFVRQAAGNGDRNKWMQELSSLQKGECLSIGPLLNENTGKLENIVARIKITSLEDRGF